MSVKYTPVFLSSLDIPQKERAKISAVSIFSVSHSSPQSTNISNENGFAVVALGVNYMTSSDNPSSSFAGIRAKNVSLDVKQFQRQPQDFIKALRN